MNWTISLGLDIGGANTKAVLLKDEKIKRHWFEYIPLWREKERLGHFLGRVAGSVDPDVVGATLTGELCDVFKSKRDGVIELVELVCGTFGGDVCLFMSSDGRLVARDRSLASPLKLAAANWVASSLVVGEKYQNCILIDVGSTTTDIIPIAGGKPASGRTDFQRLRRGELIYTGVLRTPLPCICSEIRLGKGKIGVAAESFSITADVYRVLEMIKGRDYTCETPDGRGKDKRSCMRRIARILCSDLEELNEGLVREAAGRFHREQVGLISRSLERVADLNGLPRTTEVIVTGLGRKILAERAARVVGFSEVIDLADVYGEEAALMTPAFCMGLLAGRFKIGRSDQDRWKFTG